MAPVIDHQLALDHGTQLALQSFAIVESIERRHLVPYRYKSCNSFILHSVDTQVYVAVPRKNLKASDILNVRFPNDVADHEARLYSSISDLQILEITAPGNHQPVVIDDEVPGRTDVIIIGQADMEEELQFNTYTSSVIFPRNSTRFFTRGREAGTEVLDSNFFTIGFSADMDIKRLIGAPVHALSGHFLGMIHSFQDDAVFVRRASYYDFAGEIERIESAAAHP